MVLALVKDYVASHPDITYEELEKVFPKHLQGKEVFTTEDIAKSKPSIRYFIKPEDIIVLKVVRIVVSSKWGTGIFFRFVEYCKKQMEIEIQ